MIVRISGKILERGVNYIVIDMGGVSYEVLIPTAVIERLDENISANGEVKLVTYHYYQVEPSRSTPVLIGFLNEIEKEFFQAFITVSGIGPRAAVKALNKPISLIAKAIDESNIDFLRSLPGIGPQRAKEIVAKLQNKVGKFGLIQDSGAKEKDTAIKNIEDEVLAVLMQLQYKKSEAVSMINKALERSPGTQTTEGLLNEVYKQRRAK